MIQREIHKLAAKYKTKLPTGDFVTDRQQYAAIVKSSGGSLESFEIFEYSVITANLQELAKAWGFENEFKQMIKKDLFHQTNPAFLYESVSKAIALKLRSSPSSSSMR